MAGNAAQYHGDFTWSRQDTVRRVGSFAASFALRAHRSVRRWSHGFLGVFEVTFRRLPADSEQLEGGTTAYRNDARYPIIRGDVLR